MPRISYLALCLLLALAIAGVAAEEVDGGGVADESLTPPGPEPPQHQQCSSDGYAAPYLAAILIARTGNTENLKAALASLATAADMLVLIPWQQEGGNSFPASVVAPDLPGAGKLTHHSISWTDSFAEAHHAALQVAQQAGASWAVLLDDSEELKAHLNALELKEVLKNAPASVLHCYEEKPYTKPRFFKLPGAGFFVGPTFELFITTDNSSPTPEQLLKNVSFPKQQGVDQQVLWVQDKRMLQDYLDTKPPVPARWLFYLGETLEEQGDHAAAAAAFERSAALATNSEEAAWALYRCALCFEKDKAGAMVVQKLTQALGRKPCMPEAAWLLALVAYHSRKYADAISWATMSASQGCFNGTCACKSRMGYRDTLGWFIGPYDVLRYTHQQLGQSAAAAEAESKYKAAEEQLAKFLEEEEPVMGLHQMRQEEVPYLQVVQPKKHQKPRVAVAFITANRPHLFQRTFNSFRQHCLDCNSMVDAWFAIDDFSSDPDLEDMQKTAPPCFVTWINKSEEEKGHIGSMNKLMEEVQGFDYLVNIEDDFLFIKDGDLISRAIDIMDADRTIGQVLFNRDYLETDVETEVRKITATEDARVTPAGTQYLVHTQVGLFGSAEWIDFWENKMAKNMMSNFHWPHFAFRPGVWRLSAIRSVGMFNESLAGYAQPEFDFAKRYVAAGFKTAFLPGVYCVHLAVSKYIRGGMFGDVEGFDGMYARRGLEGITVTSSKPAYVLRGISQGA